MINPLSEIAIANQKKYLKPPTWEQIEEFMEILGTHNKLHIERFYGMPYNTLSNVKCGQRTLPFEFWHIIYEKVVPNYGVGFIQEYADKIVRQMKIKRHKKRGAYKKNKPAKLEDQHSRLSKLL